MYSNVTLVNNTVLYTQIISAKWEDGLKTIAKSREKEH